MEENIHIPIFTNWAGEMETIHGESVSIQLIIQRFIIHLKETQSECYHPRRLVVGVLGFV